MKEQKSKFNEGDIVKHKASDEKIVILKILKFRWFRIRQKYIVRWFNSKNQEYHIGSAYENELYKN